MFSDFLMFVAPVLVIILAISLSFWAAAKSKDVKEED